MDWWHPGLPEACTRVVESQLSGPPVRGPQGGYRDVGRLRETSCTSVSSSAAITRAGAPKPQGVRYVQGSVRGRGSCGAWQEAGSRRAGEFQGALSTNPGGPGKGLLGRFTEESWHVARGSSSAGVGLLRRPLGGLALSLWQVEAPSHPLAYFRLCGSATRAHLNRLWARRDTGRAFQTA